MSSYYLKQFFAPLIFLGVKGRVFYVMHWWGENFYDPASLVEGAAPLILALSLLFVPPK